MKTDRNKVNYRPRLERRLRGLFDYFRKARIRLERMHETPAAAEDIEQAAYAYLDSIVLACAYLDALSVFRYGQGGQSFIRFLQNYPTRAQQGWYRKVS